MDLPEAILVGLLARLPLKSVARFKSVCGEWKRLLESAFFRDFYLSLNRNLSSPWSFMCRDMGLDGSLFEVASYNGCKRWGLNSSLGSYISSLEKDTRAGNKEVGVLACTDGLVLLYAIPASGERWKYYVGNPLLRQWIEIPPPFLPCRRFQSLYGLVTRKDNGVLVGYKVVRVVNRLVTATRTLKFQIYSSETGAWTCKSISSSRKGNWMIGGDPINLNGNLHWPFIDLHILKDHGVVAHDFYANGDTEAQRCRFIRFPTMSENPYDIPHRVCSTSGGFLVYTERAITRNGNEWLAVWRLSNYRSGSGQWQVLWKIDMGCTNVGVNYVPVAMHPFDTDTIYLWHYTKRCMISGNLRTQKFTFHDAAEQNRRGGIRGFSNCGKHIVSYYTSNHVHRLQCFTQFVLPLWLEPLPRPLSSPDRILDP